MAQIYKIPVVTTGPNAALLRKLTKIDARESAGTLALIAPGHFSSPAAPEIPAANTDAALSNLFLAQAKVLLPAASDASLGATLRRSTSFANDTKGKVEYTAKKGVHGIVSNANPLVNGDFLQIALGTNLRDYFYTNRSHLFYTSLWSQSTRAAGTAYNTSLLDFGAGSTSQDYAHFVHMSTGVGTWNQNNNNGRSGANFNTPGSPIRRWNSGSGKPTMAASGFGTVSATWGASGNYNSAVIANNASILPSWIFYEFFIEDLTVSGRTWQEVEAIDAAEFTKAFAPGGRYYNDTFTAPTALP